MILSPPFLPQHNATDHDDHYLPTSMPIGGFGNGAFPLGLNLAWHGGIHVQAPRDDRGILPVLAIADGTVAYVRQPKPMPKTQDAIDKDPLGYNGWTDNGCVVIRHQTEIGEDVTVSFFSIILHLKKISDGVKQGQKIWRKDEVGEAGAIDGESGHIHFEIISDDENLAQLIGRPGGSLSTGQDGRTASVFGEIYVLLPKGATFYAEKPLATATSVPSPTPAVHTSAEDYFIGIRYIGGDPLTTTYKADSSVIGTTAGIADVDLYEEANTIANAYAQQASKPTPVSIYELLRFGRTIGSDTLHPADVPYWRKVAYPGGVGWVNLHAQGTHAFSDADFPYWRGWQPISDDPNADSRCDSSSLLDLILQETSNDSVAARANQIANPAAEQQRKAKVLAKISNADIQARLARTICKFPTEWEKSSVANRWQWLTTETPADGGPLAGPYLQKEDFPKFQAHAEALCFWEEANLGISSLHWHFHPIEFIQQFRKCGWLSRDEMIQLFPKTAMRPKSKTTWVSESVSVSTRIIATYQVDLNKATRRYGIVTPLRMAAFYGNTMQETQWFATLAEKINKKKKIVNGKPVITNGKTVMEDDPPRYAPWVGRGFMQLTWPDNYIKYWRFKGKSVSDDLAEKLHNAAHKADVTRTNASLEALEADVPIEMKQWRNDLGNNASAAADSAGAYWAWSRATTNADNEPSNIRATKPAGKLSLPYYTSVGFGQVAATVNVGHPSTNYASVNGIVARFQAYNTCEAVLLDTPTFPSAGGKSLSAPENYVPRHP